MDDLKVSITESTQVGTEQVPLMFEKDINRDTAVAFPPPSVGQLNEYSLEI
jgi:hypothetical protein